MKYLSDKNLTVKETEKVLAGNELVLIAPAKSAANSVDIAKGEWIKGLKTAIYLWVILHMFRQDNMLKSH